jgi:hypothetical protein
VVCIASGPSLNPADVELVRQWRGASTAQAPRGVVVTNTTFRAAPWADALMAMDKPWWDRYRQEVAVAFRGERLSTNPIPAEYGVRRLPPTFKGYANSGAAAVSFAVNAGAHRVLMLGYDCQHTGGRTHWHGSHPAGLGDAASTRQWLVRFGELARDLAHKAHIVNCSRETALTMFERQPLETCLALQ